MYTYIIIIIIINIITPGQWIKHVTVFYGFTVLGFLQCTRYLLIILYYYFLPPTIVSCNRTNWACWRTITQQCTYYIFLPLCVPIRECVPKSSRRPYAAGGSTNSAAAFSPIYISLSLTLTRRLYLTHHMRIV